jgi:hypothetical protein
MWYTKCVWGLNFFPLALNPEYYKQNSVYDSYVWLENVGEYEKKKQ